MARASPYTQRALGVRDGGAGLLGRLPVGQIPEDLEPPVEDLKRVEGVHGMRARVTYPRARLDHDTAQSASNVPESAGGFV